MYVFHLPRTALQKEFCYDKYFKNTFELRAEMLEGLHLKCPLFLSDFKPTCNMLANFERIFKFHVF